MSNNGTASGAHVPCIDLLADWHAEDKSTVQELTGSPNCKCAEVRATLLVNFGPEGRMEDGIINKKMGTMNMLMAVLRHLHGQANNAICVDFAGGEAGERTQDRWNAQK